MKDEQTKEEQNNNNNTGCILVDMLNELSTGTWLRCAQLYITIALENMYAISFI